MSSDSLPYLILIGVLFLLLLVWDGEADAQQWRDDGAPLCVLNGYDRPCADPPYDRWVPGAGPGGDTSKFDDPDDGDDGSGRYRDRRRTWRDQARREIEETGGR